MSIAIPLFEKRISPYFDYAPALLLVRVEAGTVIGRQETAIAGWDVRQRIAYVKKNDVQLLICGGITNQVHAQIKGAGIQVIPWVSGEADKAIALYLKGRLEAGAMLCGGRLKRWCFCRQHTRNKQQG